LNIRVPEKHDFRSFTVHFDETACALLYL